MKSVFFSGANDYEMIQIFKSTAADTLSEYCDTGWYASKFHLLDHLADDISQTGSIQYIDASPYDAFNKHIMKA